MMKVEPVGKMKKDLARIKKRKYDLELLELGIKILRSGEPMPREYDKHPLHGKYKGCSSITLMPDWRLIYYIEDDCVYLVRTGTHSDLYN
jgi:mRNA interferase YafQ